MCWSQTMHVRNKLFKLVRCFSVCNKNLCMLVFQMHKSLCWCRSATKSRHKHPQRFDTSLTWRDKKITLTVLVNLGFKQNFFQLRYEGKSLVLWEINNICSLSDTIDRLEIIIEIALTTYVMRNLLWNWNRNHSQQAENAVTLAVYDKI